MLTGLVAVLLTVYSAGAVFLLRELVVTCPFFARPQYPTTALLLPPLEEPGGIDETRV